MLMGTYNWRTTLAKIIVSLAMVLLVAVSFGGNADRIGQEYTETGLKRALITFATARAINGLISVAQGTEVAIQPGGIGAVLTPGEILDPINDLVEQFSQVMLYSTVVLGTQKLLIEISGWVWYSALLASVLFFCLASLWVPHLFTPATRRVTLGLSGILLLARFLVPVAAVANEAVFDLFLEPGYESANRHLENATRELGNEGRSAGSSQEPAGSGNAMWEALENFYASAKAKTDVGAELEALRTAANKTAENIVDLIVLFMIQTLLLPFLFAWLGYSAARHMARYALLAPPKHETGSEQ